MRNAEKDSEGVAEEISKENIAGIYKETFERIFIENVKRIPKGTTKLFSVEFVK